MRKVVILQPSYLPWLGYLNQIANADTFVFFDTVQFTRRDWRNRNFFLTEKGDRKLLTVPVKTKGRYHSFIHEIEIDYSQRWQKSHLQQLKAAYRQCAFFEEVFPLFQKCVEQDFLFLTELNIAIIKELAAYLELKTEFLRASEIKYSTDFENPSEHLLRICEHLQATHYLSGASAVAYLDTELFAKHSIQAAFHVYEHPVYEQQQNVPFESHLNLLDLLFRFGKKSLPLFYQKQIF